MEKSNQLINLKSEKEKSRKSIAIWGAGAEGKKQYLKLKNYYHISVFYDSDKSKGGTLIDGISVKQYDRKKIFIVIAVVQWKEIAMRLEAEKLSLIDDFVPYWMIDESEVDFKKLLASCSEHELEKYFLFIKQHKKIALIYGNCQTNILKNMLLFHQAFKEKYLVITIPMVHEFEGNRQIACIVGANILWQSIDLFIYQKVKLDNKFSEMLAADNLLSKLRNDCQKISISSVYFKGYFLQFKHVTKKVLEEFNPNGLFPFGDKYIDEYMEKERTLEEIESFLEQIATEDFLEQDEIEQECENSLQELKQRENNVDVGICDYIEKFYRTVQLFYSVNHPSCDVLYEYANRILVYLGYSRMSQVSETDMNLIFGTLKGLDMTIYPAVIKKLGFKRAESMCFPNRYLADNYLLDFKTYQREYIRNLFPEKIKKNIL